MKRLIILFLAVLLLAGSLTACSGKTGGSNESESFTQSQTSKEQAKILASLGITLDKDRIVAYRETHTYLEYIVSIYDGDKKISEKSYYFYYGEGNYEKDKDNYKNAAGVEFKDNAATVVYNSGKANTGNYAGDLELIKKDYTIRTVIF